MASLTYNIMSIISSVKYEEEAISTTLVTNLLGIVDSTIFENIDGIDRKYGYAERCQHG